MRTEEPCCERESDCPLRNCSHSSNAVEAERPWLRRGGFPLGILEYDISIKVYFGQENPTLEALLPSPVVNSIPSRAGEGRVETLVCLEEGPSHRTQWMRLDFGS